MCPSTKSTLVPSLRSSNILLSSGHFRNLGPGSCHRNTCYQRGESNPSAPIFRSHDTSANNLRLHRPFTPSSYAISTLYMPISASNNGAPLRAVGSWNEPEWSALSSVPNQTLNLPFSFVTAHRLNEHSTFLFSGQADDFHTWHRLAEGRMWLN